MLDLFGRDEQTTCTSLSLSLFVGYDFSPFVSFRGLRSLPLVDSMA